MEVAGRAGSCKLRRSPADVEGTVHSLARTPWAGTGCLLLWGARNRDRSYMRGTAALGIQADSPGKAVLKSTHGAAAGNHQQTHIPKKNKQLTA